MNKKTGRPVTVTREKIEQVIDYLDRDYLVQDACGLVGISDRSFHQHLKKYDDLHDLFLKSTKSGIRKKSQMSGKLYDKLMREENTREMLDWLKLRDDRFKPKSEIEIKGDLNISFSKEELEDLLDDDTDESQEQG